MTTTPKPDLAAKIRIGLLAGKPPQSGVDLSRGDINRAPISLKVSDIQLYDLNPRQATNKQLDAIRAWLQKDGATAANGLRVTKRPGSDQYMLCAGGNTRIQVLKELWESTGDPKYLRVNCFYEEYKAETSILAASLSENMTRSDMTLWDQTKGIIRLKQMLEKESGTEISQRDFVTVLEEKFGFKISHMSISFFNYAHGTLLPVVGEEVMAKINFGLIKAIRPLCARLIKEFEATLLADENAFLREFCAPVLQKAAQTGEWGNVLEDIESQCRARANTVPTVAPESAPPPVEKEAKAPPPVPPTLPVMTKPPPTATAVPRETAPVPASSPPIARDDEVVEKETPPGATPFAEGEGEGEGEGEAADPKIRRSRYVVKATDDFNAALHTFANVASQGLARNIVPNHEMPFGCFIDTPAFIHQNNQSNWYDIKFIGPRFFPGWWFIAHLLGQFYPPFAPHLKNSRIEKLLAAPDFERIMRAEQASDGPAYWVFTTPELALATAQLIITANAWVATNPPRFTTYHEYFAAKQKNLFTGLTNEADLSGGAK